jgi:hypothetical protein
VLTGYAARMEHTDETSNIPDRERDPADAPEPRGNPEPDEEAVKKSEEKLDEISGN